MTHLEQTLYEHLGNAMKEHNQTKVNILRIALNECKKVRVSPGHTEELTEVEVEKVLQKLVKQGRDAVEQYKAVKRYDLVKEEIEQLLVLEEFLPKQLTEEEIRTEVIKAINSSENKSIGPLMKILNTNLAGKADGKTIAKILKEELLK